MKKIGIIGFGNMGSAIAERAKAQFEIAVFDNDTQRTRNLSGIKVAQRLTDLLAEVDAVVLAIKPQDFDGLLVEIKDLIHDKLVVSIAAGIYTSYLEGCLGKVRVIRAMPNLPASVGKGMTCLCKGKFASEEDLNFVRQLFDSIGKTLIIDEEKMSAATAISGSGPGLLYDLIIHKGKEIIAVEVKKEFIAPLASYAENKGFPRQQAEMLASVTTSGSFALLELGGLTALELRDRVASKGGTTEAGLEILHKGGSLQEAVEAARIRAEELSKKG